MIVTFLNDLLSFAVAIECRREATLMCPARLTRYGSVRLVKNLSVQRSVSDAKSYGRRGREVRREKRNMPFRECVEP